MPFYISQRPLQRGFTLTELVVIIVIIGAVMVTAAPRFIGIQTFESRGFYEEVLSALRYAQKMAVGTGCQIQFTITTAPDTYGMFRETACNNSTFAGSASIANPRTGAAYPTVAPADVTLSGVVNFPIVFNALGQAVNAGGSPDASPTATVNVDGRTITIRAETGLVTGP